MTLIFCACDVPTAMHRAVTHSAILRAFMRFLGALMLASCDGLELDSFENSPGRHRIVMPQRGHCQQWTCHTICSASIAVTRKQPLECRTRREGALPVGAMKNCGNKWARVSMLNRLAALIALLVVFVAFSHAQDPQAQSSVEGTVRDSRGGPVQGATAHLLAQGTAGDVMLRTDAKGACRYVALAAGEYTIRVEKSGYVDASFGPFALREGQSTTIELTLTAATEKPQGVTTEAPQFFDQPQFTVAGVTDATNHGGHGSDAVSRTTQSLAHDVTTLDGKPTVAAQPAAATEASLRETLQRNPGDFDANCRLGAMLASAG